MQLSSWIFLFNFNQLFFEFFRIIGYILIACNMIFIQKETSWTAKIKARLFWNNITVLIFCLDKVDVIAQLMNQLPILNCNLVLFPLDLLFFVSFFLFKLEFFPEFFGVGLRLFAFWGGGNALGRHTCLFNWFTRFAGNGVGERIIWALLTYLN